MPSLFSSLLFLLIASSPPQAASAHRSPSTYASTGLTEWRSARASYYAASDPRDTVGGACGYGDLGKSGYGLATVGLSDALYQKGLACGGCYEVRCVDELKYCIPGTSILLTATNYCAPNFGLPADAGGMCNPPNHHFIMPIAAFEKIAIWKAGVVPVQYRRVKCIREGGIRFAIDGRKFFYSVLISNVAGGGDITAVKIKGAMTGWLPMGRNWGQNWHISADLKGQALSFELITSDGVTLTSYNVAPRDWAFGRTYVGNQFPF
ncbi:alpha-expansin 13 precursor [Iris pallida]|uniref:Expansin n=1 Tax=Iris pallida TaxID=29817 RepID=A0AAX6FKP6_IRIPA|nr:alpha-expansin 13 precursor [Iris pallida]KAJ6824658.1 alpha-expansin 13 precursor [Iris pallida]